MLNMTAGVFAAIVAHCVAGLPDEACGLLAGSTPVPMQPGASVADGLGAFEGSAQVLRWYPTRNVAASARLYEVDPRDLLVADRDAEALGIGLIGVVHSHTHTGAYPSPTDVRQAPDPSWHYVLVSLAGPIPVMRSYRIKNGQVAEERLVVTGR